MTDTPTIPLVLTLTGAYLAWFGVHYWRTDVQWPSDPVKAVLTGKGIPPATRNTDPLANIFTPVATNPDVTGAIGDLANGAAGPGIGFKVFDKAGLQALWTSNGGSPTEANIAAAVAMAESSGRADATSANPDGGTNVGLWQLDTRGVGSGYSITQLSDPATNARVTVMGSLNGANWGPWQTYAEGTYKKFL